MTCSIPSIVMSCICVYIHIQVFPKIVVPQMDGENNGKPYFLMDDLGGNNPLFSETSIHVYPPGN